MATTEYYSDILLLGRKGQGKSMTARKLINHSVVSITKGSKYQPWEEFEGSKETENYMNDSATSQCMLLLSKNGKLRILDTPGFADDNELGENFQILNSILRKQQRNDLAFRRVLYFLPQRGPLERADGTLQEEIQVIHDFLGDEVFKVMVVIATNTYRKGRPEERIDDEDIEKTKQAFLKSMEEITNTTNQKCPPILYLPYLNEDVGAILSIPTLGDKPMSKPAIVEFSNTNPATEELVQREAFKNRGSKIEFYDRCLKCSTMVIYSCTSRGRIATRTIINEGSESELMVSYNSSKCHPYFIPRYSNSARLIGVFMHIFTIGIFFLIEVFFGKKYWPNIYDTEQICSNCEREPLSEPCLQIHTRFGVRTDSGYVDVLTRHLTTLDKMQKQSCTE